MKSQSTPSEPPIRLAPMDWALEAGKEDHLVLEIRRRLKARQRKRTKLAAGAAALAALLFYVIPTVRSTSNAQTPAGSRGELSLEDGSHVDLNSQTVLHADFRYGRRTVTLSQGEAFFSVAKDAAHPFVVDTPHGTVRVMGTRFDVRLADHGVDVTLIDGSVDFNVEETSPSLPPGARGGDASSTLRPGQQLSSVNGATLIRTLSPADLDKLTAWRQGKLILEGLTLSQAAAQMARYHGCQIRVSPEVAGIPLGGTCPLDDLPGFLNSLSQAFRVKIQPLQGAGYAIEAK